MNNVNKETEFSNLPIDFLSLPKLEEQDFLPIQKKYLRVILLEILIGFSIVTAIVLSLYYLEWIDSKFFRDNLWLFLAAVLLITLVTVVVEILAFKWKGYALRERDLTFRKGWIFRKAVYVPFNRIQHAVVQQSLMDRLFGLAKLKVYTAGGSQSDLVIPGLLNEEALRLKTFVLKQTSEEDEAEV